MKLAAADEQRIQAIGKASGSALRVHRLLQAEPILSIASAGEELKLTVPTVTASLKHLAKLGIARETTGRNYGRIYAYDKYLKILNEGTEPLIIQYGKPRSPLPAISRSATTFTPANSLKWMLFRVGARTSGDLGFRQSRQPYRQPKI